MEYWNEQMTRASWDKLVGISKEYDFVLIGGWAAYLWTGLHKSKDIDIVVDYDTLAKLKLAYQLQKNDRLKKYEVKADKFDIDIYVPHYSELSLPLEEVVYGARSVQGFRAASPEMLLILKQGAEIDRRGSVKGLKDAIDILTLLLRANVDLKEYASLVKKHGLSNYPAELSRVISTFGDRDLPYLGISFVSFKKWRKKILGEIRKLK
ncbi:MAG: hypothetical protein NT157_02125 [Candidatus Micrarchaeota archaeon]|nr:hypothetical protein [Candidatus Micrarchaeota archaeon]